MAILKKLKNILPALIWKMGAAAKHEYVKAKFLKGKRDFNPAETSKAKERRVKENFFDKY